MFWLINKENSSQIHILIWRPASLNALNLLHSGNHLTGTFINSGDPADNAAFHQGLHSL